jgi:predicted GH43/DUF377 family glycosyl hydrolase
MRKPYSLIMVLVPFMTMLSPAIGFSDEVNVSSFTDRGVMMYGDKASTSKPFAKDPTVKKFKGKYFLYYSCLAPSHDSKQIWRIGIATSDDLVTWKKIGMLKPEQEAESKGICAPGAVVIGDRMHLFYQTYGNKEKDAICHAWSDDGVHFTRDPTNPVFRPHGSWTCGRAIDADAIPFGNRLLLFFATRDPSYTIQMIGVAEAPLDSDFSRSQWKQLADRPILKPELPWEKKCIEAASVIPVGDGLVMFYAGAYNNSPQQIGCAKSRDGIHWKRIFKEPLLVTGAPGSWNSSESGHPGIFGDSDGKTYLFYQGNNDNGASWYLSKVALGWNKGIPFVIKSADSR